MIIVYIQLNLFAN